MEDLFNEIKAIFPRPLLPEEESRAQVLVIRAQELIELEFARRRRDLELEKSLSPWIATAVKQAVIMMVSRAVLIGDSIGRASMSSATGPQSDSVTWSQNVGIQWGGVEVTPEILALLGLATGAVPRGRGGTVVPFGQRVAICHGAEGSEHEQR